MSGTSPYTTFIAIVVSRIQRIGRQPGKLLLFVVLGLRCLLDCHVLKGFGIYMIGILDRLY